MKTNCSLVVLQLVLICTLGHAADKIPALPELREELLVMIKEDQDARAALGGISIKDQGKNQHLTQRVMNADRANTKRMMEIVSRHGWPTISMVGEDGANAAWLLVQHADRDKEFQSQMLVLMTKQLDLGEVAASQVAYLHDRLKRPQRYGTQGRCVGPGKWEPNEMEDSTKVDQLREVAGISPPKLQDYIARMNSFCK